MKHSEAGPARAAGGPPAGGAPTVGKGSAVGPVILAILVTIAAVGTYRRMPTPVPGAAAPAATPARPPLPAELPGFRSDAWYLPDDPTLGFVEIPGGPFLAGSDPSVDPLAFDNEAWSGSPGYTTVDLPAFYIGRFEVTVAQFRAFVDATGHPVDEAALRAPPDHPVAMVSWPDAHAYARWLDGELRTSSLTPAPIARLLAEGWRVTLPTEVQWEKAARGTDGRIYPWGNQVDDEAANLRGRGTLPVGSRPCPGCAHGLADMTGNVWEWTRSPYSPRPAGTGETAQPVDLSADALWVMRGGSFLDEPRNARAAVRGGADPGVRRPFIGFRLVLSRDAQL